MRHCEGHFAGCDNIQLFYQSWHPQSATRAGLIIIHGFGEHGGRYHNVVQRLVPKGYAIYAPDHRGHGRSPGQRGFVNSLAEFRDDVHAMFEVVRGADPAVPIFMFGHSMGGVITLDYAIRNPSGLAGVIVSAPAIGATGISPALRFLARLLSGIWPTLSIRARLDPGALSRDKDELQRLASDPLVHGIGSPRLATEVSNTAKRIQDRAAEFRLPILIAHGAADRVVSPEGSQRFFNNLTHDDKKYIRYPGGFHESHNDLNHEEAVTNIEMWLEEQLTGPSAACPKN